MTAMKKNYFISFKTTVTPKGWIEEGINVPYGAKKLWSKLCSSGIIKESKSSERKNYFLVKKSNCEVQFKTNSHIIIIIKKLYFQI